MDFELIGRGLKMDMQAGSAALIQQMLARQVFHTRNLILYGCSLTLIKLLAFTALKCIVSRYTVRDG